MNALNIEQAVVIVEVAQATNAIANDGQFNDEQNFALGGFLV